MEVEEAEGDSWVRVLPLAVPAAFPVLVTVALVAGGVSVWAAVGAAAAGSFVALAHYAWLFYNLFVWENSDEAKAGPVWLKTAFPAVAVVAPGVLGIAVASLVAQGDLLAGLVAPIGGGLAAAVTLLVAERVGRGDVGVAGYVTFVAVPYALTLAAMTAARHLL